MATQKTTPKSATKKSTMTSAKTSGKTADTATAKTSGKPSGKSGGSGTAHLPKNENVIVLLAGGNPQIPKGDGDGPVQLYIANMPGWKSALGQRLDTLIVKAVPKVEKAVRWNSPFYGAGQGWFLSFHVLTKYVKVTFFNGAALTPPPPGSTPKSGDARWIDIHENDDFDEALFTKWVKQAATRPGWSGT